jgi:hypothetical protein
MSTLLPDDLLLPDDELADIDEADVSGPAVVFVPVESGRVADPRTDGVIVP